MLFAYLFTKLYFCWCDFIFRIVNLNQFQALQIWQDNLLICIIVLILIFGLL